MAEPYFVFTYYDELARDKVRASPSKNSRGREKYLPFSTPLFFAPLSFQDVVLVRGDVLSPHVYKEDASQVLALKHHMIVDDEKFKLVDIFNNRPAEFNFDEFVKACPENLNTPSPQTPTSN